MAINMANSNVATTVDTRTAAGRDPVQTKSQSESGLNVLNTGLSSSALRADVVSLQHAQSPASDASGAVRWGKVEAVRKSIEEGSWEIPPEALADTLIKKGILSDA